MREVLRDSGPFDRGCSGVPGKGLQVGVLQALASSFLLVLSEQVLHLWLEVLCSSLPTVEKWYQPWSFLRSPGWVQIKCELR